MALRPLGRVVGRASAFAERRPVVVSLVTTMGKAWLADLMIQKLVEKRETVDRSRSAMFAGFGLVYQGAFQYFMYNVLYERVLFRGVSARMTLAKIAATNLISDPIFFFPTFYCFREAMASDSWADLDLTVAVPAALQKYRNNCMQDWQASWMIWVPGHIVTYAICPVHLRMPWIATVRTRRGSVCV